MSKDDEAPLSLVERFAQEIFLRAYGLDAAMTQSDKSWIHHKSAEAARRSLEIAEAWFEGHQKWRDAKVKKVMDR